MKTSIGVTRRPRSRVSNAVKLALLASSAPLVLGTSMALGQETVTDDDEQIEEIITTGSRIVDPNLEQASQILVMSESEILDRHALDAEQLVGELPGMAPTAGNRSVNNGSNGTARLNLRGLGSHRNIILVDGQRIVPADNLARTDLNNIPMALVERVDIITGGASSVYGADAVAGVTNFITKRDFEGVQIAFTSSETTENDAGTNRIDLTVGGNFEGGRGNAVLNIGWQDVDALLQGERKYSQVATFGTLPLGSGTSHPTRIGGVMYDPATGQSQPSSTFNYAPFNYFQTPTERYNVFGKAHYEVASGHEVYGNVLFSRNTVDLQLAPSGLFGDTWQMPLNNPFLPDFFRNQICATALVPIDQATCDAAGAAVNSADPDYIEVPTVINRRLVEQGNRENEYRTTMWQLTAGVRGDVTDNIQYDVFAQYGESDKVSTRVNWGLKSLLQQTLRATDENTCDPTTNPGTGCVPINLFGPGDGLNISDETIAYWSKPSGSTQRTTLTAAIASISGDFDAWTDIPIGWAAGFEHRKYEAAQISDIAEATQDEVLGTGAPAKIFGGEFDVNEYFVEAIVPIVSGLQLETGARFSDYSTSGSSTTWKAGLTWQPVDSVKFRSIFQESERSPNVFELFQPPITGLNNLIFDPCQGMLADAVTPNPALANPDVRNICIAQGAPAVVVNNGTIPPPSANQINETSGGNELLDVETAESLTFGIVFTPVAVPELTITLDYYNIKIEDAITTPTPDDIFGPCFGPGTAGDPFNSANPSSPGCALIGRNPLNGSMNGGGDTLGIITQLTNQGTIETSGYDFRITYDWAVDAGALDALVFDFVGNITDENLFQASPTSINRDCVGQFSENCDPNLPEFTFNFRTTADLGDWGAVSLLMRHQDKLVYEKILDNPFEGSGLGGKNETEFLTMDAETYFDLSWMKDFDYGEGNTFSVAFLIQNLTDEDPPITGSFLGGTGYNSGNTYPANYDVLGTRWSLTGTIRF